MTDRQPSAQSRMYEDMFHPSENRILMICLAAAVLFHAGFFFIRWKEIDTRVVEEPVQPPRTVIYKTVLPPPPMDPTIVVAEEIALRVPLPDPKPREPEPISEPQPEIAPERIDLDFTLPIGDPEPPPPSGPMIPGIQGVTNPVLIPGSKTEPQYPETARMARQSANLVLQAIIYKDGTVGEVVVLRCTRPNLGFEQAAIQAVLQWRYAPATQNGIPVDVYFTIQVSFHLN